MVRRVEMTGESGDLLLQILDRASGLGSFLIAQHRSRRLSDRTASMITLRSGRMYSSVLQRFVAMKRKVLNSTMFSRHARLASALMMLATTAKRSSPIRPSLMQRRKTENGARCCAVSQIEEAVNAAYQIIGRDVIVEVEGIEQPFLTARLRNHHPDVLPGQPCASVPQQPTYAYSCVVLSEQTIPSDI